MLHTPPAKRFAERPLRSPSPEARTDQGFVFCQRCLTNQQIYTRAIAEYLPDEDHPDYQKFENGLEAYKKRLEEQYPQVCAKCEPLARARMNAISQEVRQNHLSQCLQWTREKMGRKEPLQWSVVPHVLGGATWILSLAAQLLWHLFYATKAAEIQKGDGLLDPDSRTTLPQCVISLSTARPCLGLYEEAVRIGLYMGLLSCWWNPKMGRKPLGARNNLLGLFQYYRLQFLLLVVRVGAWKTLSSISLDLNLAQGSHALALIFIFSLSTVLWRTVEWEMQPKVNWHISDEPLVQVQPISTQDREQPFRPLPSSNPPNRFTRSRQQLDAVNLQDFGRGTDGSKDVQQVPTPPNEEENDPDSMDWTPSQTHNFSLMKDYRTSKSTATSIQSDLKGRSPFHGTLPANPRSQAARLRNPQPMSRPIEMTPGPRDNLFAKKKTEDNNSIFSVSTTASPAKFAPARFFAPSDNAETGLESMFSTAFRMREESSPVKEVGPTGWSKEQPLPAQGIRSEARNDRTQGAWAGLYRLGLQLMTCVVWVNMEGTSIQSKLVQGACLLTNALVVLSRAFTLSFSFHQMVYILEFSGLVSIGFGMVFSISDPRFRLRESMGEIGFWCLFATLAQEMWITFFRNTPSSETGRLGSELHNLPSPSPPRHPWDYAQRDQEEPSSTFSSSQELSPHGFGAPSPAPSQARMSRSSNVASQFSLRSPSPSTSAFSQNQASTPSYSSQTGSRREQTYRTQSERQPSFLPNGGGFSVSHDVVAPRRSARNHNREYGRLDGRGGFGGLSLG